MRASSILPRSLLARVALPRALFGGHGGPRDEIVSGVRDMWSQLADDKTALVAARAVAGACAASTQFSSFVEMFGKVERNVVCFRSFECALQRRKLQTAIQDFGELQVRRRAVCV